MMKRIAFFIEHLDLYGGIERVTANLAAELAKYAKVSIVARSGSLSKDRINWYPANVELIELGILSIRPYREFFKWRKRLYEFINKHEFDVVIFQVVSVGFFGKDIRRFTNARVIFCDHGSIFSPLVMTSKKDRNMLHRSVIGCDNLIVLTEKCRDSYIDKFHIQPDKIKVIPNWADDVSIKPSYNTDSKTIISVGRFDIQKGFDLLIESFSFVHRNNPDWQLDIYGDGAEKENIERLIDRYALGNCVTLKGKRLDVKDLYAGYSFYVMSSRYEGLPMVLLEAKQNYLPIVSFDIDAGPSDVIEDDINGLLVKSGDTKAMADAMCKIIENPDLRKRMSENSQLGMEMFSKEKVLSEWLDVLQIVH